MGYRLQQHNCLYRMRHSIKDQSTTRHADISIWLLGYTSISYLSCLAKCNILIIHLMDYNAQQDKIIMES